MFCLLFETIKPEIFIQIPGFRKQFYLPDYFSMLISSTSKINAEKGLIFPIFWLP